MGAVTLPLADWAQQRLAGLAALASRAQLPAAEELMLERARFNDLAVPGKISSGGGCRFYKTCDGWIALNLARSEDKALLPALFMQEDVSRLEALFAVSRESEIVARGRLLGLAIAGLRETLPSPAVTTTADGPSGTRAPVHVLDLSALWAGPLASRLLQLAGCHVTRVESVGREDSLALSDPAHSKTLNTGKRIVRVDLRTQEGRDELRNLIAGSDIVIEAARPRALQQLRICANEIVRRQTGLTWITITGHGIAGDAAEWIGFGDDAGVAGGLSRELHAASGSIGFVGDAIADPLTGITTAHIALTEAMAGGGTRIVVSMSGLVSQAIAWSRDHNCRAWQANLRKWALLQNRPFPAPSRAPSHAIREQIPC